MGDILGNIRDRYIQEIALIENRGGEQFTQHAKSLYGSPTKDLVKHANRLVFLKIKLGAGKCIESTPVIWRGRIYVGTWDGYFYAVGEAGEEVAAAGN